MLREIGVKILQNMPVWIKGLKITASFYFPTNFNVQHSKFINWNAYYTRWKYIRYPPFHYWQWSSLKRGVVGTRKCGNGIVDLTWASLFLTTTLKVPALLRQCYNDFLIIFTFSHNHSMSLCNTKISRHEFKWNSFSRLPSSRDSLSRQTTVFGEINETKIKTQRKCGCIPLEITMKFSSSYNMQKATRKQIRYEAEIPWERIKIAIFHELTHCFDAHGQSSQVVSFTRLASREAHKEHWRKKDCMRKK